MNKLPEYQPEWDRRTKSKPAQITDPASAVLVLAQRLRGLQAVRA